MGSRVNGQNPPMNRYLPWQERVNSKATVRLTATTMFFDTARKMFFAILGLAAAA
jgi:hypothetical protein